jgi:arginyl-tRNA synthetase
LIDRASDVITSKISNDELSESEKQDVAEKVAIASIKYSLLKVGREQDQVFDFDTTISFEGNSGPYIMYSYARAKGIIAKSSENIAEMKFEVGEVSIDEHERNLLVWLSYYPEYVSNAARDFSPHVIATYLFELAQLFNVFYTRSDVIHEENSDLKAWRLSLLESISNVLEHGMNLLGMPIVQKM